MLGISTIWMMPCRWRRSRTLPRTSWCHPAANRTSRTSTSSYRWRSNCKSRGRTRCSSAS
eukprot:5782781-Prymnesium_polylepis.1